MEVCQSVVTAGVSREMSAQCEAFMAVLSSGNIGTYRPSQAAAHPFLDELKNKYSDTDFYKKFVSWCDSYNPEKYAVSQVPTRGPYYLRLKKRLIPGPLPNR